MVVARLSRVARSLTTQFITGKSARRPTSAPGTTVIASPTTEQLPDEFGRAVKLGDEARDARNWVLAAHHYKTAVSLNPEAAGIHVQLGHSLKEAADFAGAEAAYHRALELAPDDVDLHVQLGHFYKLRGDTSAAMRYYRSARARGSRDRHVLSYLATPGLAAPGEWPAKDPFAHAETTTSVESGYPIFDFQLTSVSYPRRKDETVVFNACVELDRIKKEELLYLVHSRSLRFGCQVYAGTSDSEVIASERGIIGQDNTSPTSLIVTFSLPMVLFIDSKWRLISINCVYDGKFWFSDRGRPSIYAVVAVDKPERPDLFQYYLENFNTDRRT